MLQSKNNRTHKAYIMGIFLFTLLLCLPISSSIKAESQESQLLKYMKFLSDTDPVTRTDPAIWGMTAEQYQEISGLVSEITGSISGDYDKALAIHNWIADNIYYDYDLYNGKIGRYEITPAQVLKTRKSVCEGYAQLTEAMLNAAGIPCYYVNGTGNGGGHAWNVAYAGGRWILIDTTWDSLNTYQDGIFTENPSRILYFDMDAAEFDTTHTQLGHFTGGYGNIIYNLNCDTNELTVTGAVKGSPDITIVSSIGSYPVTAIGAGAFYGHTSEPLDAPGYYDWIETVTLPDSIRVIEGSAFMACKGLKSINIPDNVKELKNGIFMGCVSLEEIRLPEGIESFGYNTFFLCSALKTIYLPSSLRIIPSFAFAGCTSLKEIAIPDGVVQIGSCAFSECTSLTEIKLPDNLEKMEGNLFENTPITRLVIPEKVTNLPADLFWYAKDLKEIEFLSKNPEFLVKDASVSQILEGTSLERIIVPDGCKEQYLKVFSIYVLVEHQVANGDGVMKWDKNLFEQWEYNSVKGFYLPAGEIKTVRDGNGDTCREQNGLGYVVIVKAQGSAFGKVKVTGYFSLRESANGISAGKSPEKTLTSLVVPEYVTYRGNKYYVTEIGEGAFQEFQALKTVRIPGRIKKIGNYAFSKTALTNISLPSDLEELGEGAFSYSRLTSIKFPSKLRQIGEGALGACTNLKSLMVENSNKYFKSDGKVLYSKKGDILYTAIPQKGKIVVKKGVRIIKKGAYYSSYAINSAKGKYSSSITSLVLPDTVKVVEALSLYGIGVVEFKGKVPPSVDFPIYAEIRVPAVAVRAYEKLKASGDISFLDMVFGMEKGEYVFDKNKLHPVKS